MKMAADSKQNLKQLRVDNWAVFFLQRLQLLFAKGDCCDLTLKFVSGQELKVHRLVLSTSTSFFESMESEGNVIHLPESLPYSVVQPIINFLYSGRLEFKAELHSQLLAIAKIMKLAILARILVAQKNDNGVGDHSPGKVADLKKLHLKPNTVKKIPSAASSYVNVISGKKLPIWKKRTVPYRFERKPIKEEEPRPTRFEWPDEESCTNMIMTTPSFVSLSYESAPVISPPVTPPLSLSLSLPSTSLKRRVMPPVSSVPDKIFKVEGNSVDKNETEAKNDTIPYDPNVSDDDDDDDGHFETIHTYGDSDDDPDIPVETESPVNQLKPILKPMTDTPIQTPSKKVRFSFAPEDKENKDQKITENIDTHQLKGMEKKDITNHAKIIQEVLKKYPELVKNNKNIKLKITAPGSASKPNTITIDAKKKTVQSKSSYIVLKSAVKTEATTTPSSSECIEKATSNGAIAKNTKGPWKCESCISGTDALQFDSYLELKKHLQESHLERVDSRICEFCGYKASKRNLHLYHLYTKHDVDPPKNVKFPKCSQCSYIALSESLLVKHLNSHQAAKDLTCSVCNTTFRTYSSLHVHGLSCKPNSEVRSYSCPNCKKIFKTNVSLNAHVKVCSANREECDDEEGPHTSSEIIEVPIIETVEMDKNEHAIVQLPSGIILTENSNVALLPTSDTEALNNVASGLTGSIGLTVAIPQEHQQAVILLDGGSQFFIQDNDPVVVSNDSNVEEYIVPELLRDEMGQIYTTQNVPYTVSSTGVITCPVVSLQSTNEAEKTKTTDEIEPNTTLTLHTTNTYVEGELANIAHLSSRTSLLESDDNHLESSNTRVEIKDSHAEDIEELERALRSPESPTQDEDTIQNSHEVINSSLTSLNCQTNEIKIQSPTRETEDSDGQQIDDMSIADEIQDKHNESAENETCEPITETIQPSSTDNEKDKATSLVRDWGFDNEEEGEEDAEDNDSRPSRPTMDFPLQE